MKYQVVIPTKIVVEAGWNEGDEIDFDIDREGRVRMSAHEPIPKPMKMTYDEARQSVSHILLNAASGLTWAEIHDKAPALPKKPSAFWILKFEADFGLRREKDHGRMIWRVPTNTSNLPIKPGLVTNALEST